MSMQITGATVIDSSDMDNNPNGFAIHVRIHAYIHAYIYDIHNLHTFCCAIRLMMDIRLLGICEQKI